ncbi:ROK family protein [Streptomyces sp. NBC_00564]|uniref:ROK family protein n=1 Tax=unclassified Streptomyces TaxID=2593676 RepID=UPI002FCD8537|nr:ROK family protein [Streptomyces sp. NBC_00564]
MGLPRYAIGLDVGGTKIAAGVTDAQGKVITRLAPKPCPAAEQDAVLATVVDVVKGLRAHHDSITAIGVGAAGLVDWPSGRIRTAPNSGFRDVPFRALLQEATGLPTVVDNDANTACWAEFRLGHSAPHMAFITVGTGVGGGIVLADRLFRGSSGIGTEIGHMVLDPNGSQQCGCGTVGCLEALASGTALGRYGSAAAARDPSGTLATLAGGASKVTGETVSAAALQGDPTALAQLEQLGHWLGIGLAILVNLFDLELIALGGGVTQVGDPLLKPVRASFERFVTARSHRNLPDIVPARLGTDAGWIGAALLALEHHPEGRNQS